MNELRTYPQTGWLWFSPCVLCMGVLVDVCLRLHVQLRLCLLGYQRPEMRFPSFPELVAAIRQVRKGIQTRLIGMITSTCLTLSIMAPTAKLCTPIQPISSRLPCPLYTTHACRMCKTHRRRWSWSFTGEGGR
jgi:hypothetical protein